MFLRQLTYLIALDRFRHFSRAAEYCGVSQPALSAAIRQLEHELGVTIVMRNRRVFGLTAEGERVLEWARQSVAALDNLRQEARFAQAVAGGSLSISVVPPAIQIIPHLMENLRAVVPALQLSLTVGPNAQILRDLAEQRTQIGLAYLDQIPADGPFETHCLYAEQLVLIASSRIRLPGRRRCSWQDAALLPLCLLEPGTRSRQIIDAGFHAAGCEPTVLLEANALELLHAELLAGRMASILPVAAIPARGDVAGPLQTRRLEPCPMSKVGLVRLRQPARTALMTRSWEIACGLVLDDVLSL